MQPMVYLLTVVLSTKLHEFSKFLAIISTLEMIIESPGPNRMIVSIHHLKSWDHVVQMFPRHDECITKVSCKCCHVTTVN